MKFLAQSDVSLEKVFAVLANGTPVEIFAFILIAGFFQLWVYGGFYKAMVKDRDDWKAIALDALKQNGLLIDIMESAKRGRR